MFVSEISLWGAALVACIVIIASIALAIADWQMLDNIRSNSGTDGYCCSRCLCGQSDSCLVVLSAMVRAGIGFVHLLVPLSAAEPVAKDAVAR